VSFLQYSDTTGFRKGNGPQTPNSQQTYSQRFSSATSGGKTGGELGNPRSPDRLVSHEAQETLPYVLEQKREETCCNVFHYFLSHLHQIR